jgi:hypothetical protein
MSPFHNHIKRRNPPAMTATSTASHRRWSRRIPSVAKMPASRKEVAIRSPTRARTGLCQPGASQFSTTMAALPITSIAVAILPNLIANLLQQASVESDIATSQRPHA